MQLDNDSQFVQSMIEDREQDINNIAQSIEEINGIFVDLAQLVNEQSPMIGTGVVFLDTVALTPNHNNRQHRSEH